MESVWFGGMQVLTEIFILLESCTEVSSSCTASVVNCAANMTQQLLQSGVLASWRGLVQLLLQQWPGQLSRGRENGCLAFGLTTGTMRLLLSIWAEQLIALKAAAPGLELQRLRTLVASGLEATPMFNLAAAHPEAFTAFIDCYMRSPVLLAADMMAALEVLAHAAAAVLGCNV
ncbi:hypothetical protein OEZ86_007804 [Tetradesmus obliquus]|nr:hypothetical protein OEZ86_007804 [Tetradesmus obliquus]